MLGPQEIVILVVAVVLIVKFMNRDKSGAKSARPGVFKILLAFGLLLLVPVALATIFYVKMARERPATTSTQVPGQLDAVLATKGMWASLDEQGFEANVYPSKAAAAKSLALKVRDALDAKRLLVAAQSEAADVPPDAEPASIDEAAADGDSIAELPAAELVDQEDPKITQLTAPDSFLLFNQTGEKAVENGFAHLLQLEFPISEVQIYYPAQGSTAATGPVKDDTVRVTLLTDDQHIEIEVDGKKARQIQGRMVCKIETSHGAAEVSNNYLDKQWVEDLDVYVSKRPQQKFVAGYSHQFVSSQAEASRLAFADAQMKSRLLRPGFTVTADESLVVDRFAQKLSRPYGDVWREAVLLDVSSARMKPVIAAAQHQATVVQQERFSLAAALVIVFGLTAILCFAFNYFTEGYYRGRVLLSVVTSLGLLLMWWFVGW